MVVSIGIYNLIGMRCPSVNVNDTRYFIIWYFFSLLRFVSMWLFRRFLRSCNSPFSLFSCAFFSSLCFQLVLTSGFSFSLYYFFFAELHLTSSVLNAFIYRCFAFLDSGKLHDRSTTTSTLYRWQWWCKFSALLHCCCCYCCRRNTSSLFVFRILFPLLSGLWLL